MRKKHNGIEYDEISHDRYKYQIARDFHIVLEKYGLTEHNKKLNKYLAAQERDFPIHNDYVRLDWHGKLSIFCGYAWDGPSGPAIDTKSFMRASLVHDALYQLMREGLLPQTCRKTADKIMRDVAKADGMSWPRRVWTYWGVRLGAGFAVKTGADPYRYGEK